METLADFNDTASVSARSGPPRPRYVSQPQAVAAIDRTSYPGDVEKRALGRIPLPFETSHRIVRRAIDP